MSAFAALLTCSVALLLVYAARRHPDPFTYAAVRMATIGYALPGTVLAVGIFIPIAWLDSRLSDMAMQLLHIETGPIIQGTLATMLIAYIVRFLAVSHSPIDSAMQRITEQSMKPQWVGPGWLVDFTPRPLADAERWICSPQPPWCSLM